MSKSGLRVLVLAGGPDAEAEVSLNSGATVSGALVQAGYEVRQRDITPGDLSALDEFVTWRGDLVFPMLHGAWGEGGPLQRVLEQRGLPFVGCRAEAAELCMDKHRAKQVMTEKGIPTPAFELVTAGQRRKLDAPLVVKALREGSSIDLTICPNAESVRRARMRLHRRHKELLLEKFIKGKELTVGVLDPNPQAGGNGRAPKALPPIHIVPATEFYDFQAKYHRDDTQYLFDIDLPASVIDCVKKTAQDTAIATGCRHMCRVDIMVDAENQPWVLEVNTIPGFTSHSLLPKAAGHAGIPLPQLVSKLAQWAMQDAGRKV